MDEISYQKTYKEYKADLDAELLRSAESFVRIGYLLKVARDTNILAESGYKTVAEFAEAEYSLNKTQVSRFISINDKFSENGYSERLEAAYQGYGYAKLTIMLQIPEEISAELSPEYTKAEIQAVKEEIDEEKKVSDIEILMEGTRKDQADMNILERTIHQLGETEAALFEEIYTIFTTTALSAEKIKAAMAPSGEKIYSVRIMGMGRVMLSMKDSEDRVSITPVRCPEEKEYFDWSALVEAWYMLMDTGGEAEGAEAVWEYIYGKEYPLKAKVAPVQHEEKKSPAKKETKVSKAKVEKSNKPKTAAVVEEEQIAGQMEVKDYPELIPESTYEEVNDGNSNAVKSEEPCTGDIAGMSGGTGNADANVERQQIDGDERSEIQRYHEADGTAESGGCEEDSRTIEDIWMEIYRNHSEVSKYLTVWESQHTLMERDMLQKLYDMTVAMAAGMEQLMRGFEHE